VSDQSLPDDEPLTAAELGRRAGVTQTTIKNWATKHSPPLATVPSPDHSRRFTQRDLLTFCETHPGLPAVRKVRQALRQAYKLPQRGPGDSETASDIEALKSLARNLRTAALQHLQAALTAARQAEETARSHREQLEQLAVSIASYDDALTLLTAPSTMND
jgi:hypothetical protein